MLYWPFIFLVISVIAAVLGFGGIAGAAATVAEILFGIFLVLLSSLRSWDGVQREPSDEQSPLAAFTEDGFFWGGWRIVRLRTLVLPSSGR